MAERLLRQFHPTLTISSVGLGASMGEGADPCAISAAQEHNLSLDNHCARQISGRTRREYGPILTTERRHISALCETAPEVCGKVVFFGYRDSECEIPDPYRRSCDAFDAVYALPEQSIRQQTQALNTEWGRQ